MGGENDCIAACLGSNIDLVVNSTVGISGLRPTLEFIKSDKDIALANKESLVTGGELVKKTAEDHNMKIAPIWRSGKKEGLGMYPIDSEHSAIWQCLQGEAIYSVEKLILTASGGPFREKPFEMLRGASVEQALNHPSWKMGDRITIDSATLMNKGFEVIETYWLFGIKPENIEVKVHPRSIVHSMVQFNDSSVKAQLGIPDMRLPIQYAITYPERRPNKLERANFAEIGKLEFSDEGLHTEKFKCLDLAYEAMKLGGTAPAVLNGADERAVKLFLDRKIGYTDIADSVESAIREHSVVKHPNLNDILQADKWARKAVDSYIEKKYTRMPLLSRDK